MKKLLVICFAACFLIFGGCAFFKQETPHSTIKKEWQIVPGEKIGPIPRRGTLGGLYANFGKGNVLKEEVDDGTDSGETVPGAIVFPDQAEKRIIFHYQTETGEIYGGQLKVDFLHGVKMPIRSFWKVGPGISLGTTLKELEALNGGPFKLYGFEWDFGGQVIDWNNGRLSNLNAIIQLIPVGEENSREALPLNGEKEFQSSHPLMQKIDPVVYIIQFEL